MDTNTATATLPGQFRLTYQFASRLGTTPVQAADILEFKAGKCRWCNSADQTVARVAVTICDPASPWVCERCIPKAW